MTRKSGLGQYHGSASDRGSADRYYQRPYSPHFWPQGTYYGDIVPVAEMTAEEVAAYKRAYDDELDRKGYGDGEPQLNDEPDENDADDSDYFL